MKIIDVNLKNGSYGIYIGTGAYGRLMADLSSRKGRVFLVVDSNAMAFHSHVILDAIEQEPVGIFFVDGEKEKNMDTVAAILEEAAQNDMTRSDCFVSFGGGVCGDITGFCAAVYIRGIDYYQVPTTLLSQVDSSIGGKTAVDLNAGKNLAGAFKQPSGVYIDTGVLGTLPIRELSQGKAEMIKAALISDAELFNIFEHGYTVNEENIARCVEIKLDFVAGDEFDTGKRMKLNFGHTIAHALETKTGYGDLPHGEAVAIGMAVSAGMSEKAGISSGGTTERVVNSLKNSGLPFETSISLQDLGPIMKKDKKNIDGKLNCIFITQIGNAELYPMTVDEFISMERL